MTLVVVPSDLQNALKCYLRTRDYCTTPKHIVIMCLAIIKCGVEMGNYAHVSNYVSKAEQTPDVAVRLEPGMLEACMQRRSLSRHGSVLSRHVIAAGVRTACLTAAVLICIRGSNCSCAVGARKTGLPSMLLSCVAAAKKNDAWQYDGQV